jgi:hypothetical protein
MWHEMQPCLSTLSTRPAPAPFHAELRHAVGSSMPDRCTGMPSSATFTGVPRSGDRKPRWQVTHSSSPSGFTSTAALCAATDAASSTLGVDIGVPFSTNDALPSLVGADAPWHTRHETPVWARRSSAAMPCIIAPSISSGMSWQPPQCWLASLPMLARNTSMLAR